MKTKFLRKHSSFSALYKHKFKIFTWVIILSCIAFHSVQAEPLRATDFNREFPYLKD